MTGEGIKEVVDLIVHGVLFDEEEVGASAP